ncbi:hypothetical protein QQP08_026721 [Theobroma cacao]|nr:hypothetical protein QQP08_026721 [Theobroma cacao]
MEIFLDAFTCRARESTRVVLMPVVLVGVLGLGLLLVCTCEDFARAYRGSSCWENYSQRTSIVQLLQGFAVFVFLAITLALSSIQ